MSQAAVEQTLGKLATDAEFRGRFFANPSAATWEAGLRLSANELDALAGLSPDAVARFSKGLDARIVRLCVAGPPDRATRRKPRPARDQTGDGGPEAS